MPGRRPRPLALFACLLIAGLFAWAFWQPASEATSRILSKALGRQAEPIVDISLLASSMEPALAPEHAFPASFQYLNGCFGYAVGHILQERGRPFDPLEMEERIQKPREELWKAEYKDRLAEAYGLEFHWSNRAKALFELLAQGEPVVLTYKYPLGGGKWVLHAVAAYSFDEDGIWVSDTLSGKRIRLSHDQVFSRTGGKTLYSFARVLEK